MGLFGVDIEFDPLGMVNDGIASLTSLVSGVRQSIMDNLNGVYDYLKAIYADLVERFDGAITSVEEFATTVKATIESVINDAISTITGLYDSLASTVGDIVVAVENLPDTVRSIVSNLINGATAALNEALAAMQATLLAAIKPITDKVTAIEEALTNPEKFGDLLLKALVAAW